MLQLLRVFGAKIIVHSIRGPFNACPMHEKENYARSMHGMVDLCMHHAWIMHDTCIHARNTLKHVSCTEFPAGPAVQLSLACSHIVMLAREIKVPQNQLALSTEPF